MYSNLFVSNAGSLDGLQVYCYKLKNQLDPGDFFRASKGLESRFLRQGLCAATVGDTVLVEGKMDDAQEIGGAIFEASKDPLRLDHSHLVAKQRLVQNALKIRARTLGYRGPEGGKYYQKKPYRIDFFSFHDAFNPDVSVFFDGRIGVWLDPSTRWKQLVSNFVGWATKGGLSQSEIRSYLVGKMAYCPSVRKNTSFEVEIVDVAFDSIGHHEIEVDGKRTTVHDYWTKESPDHSRWLARNGKHLDPSESPVVSVEIPRIPIRPSYPARLVRLAIDLDDPDTPPAALREKKILAPIERVRLTLELYDKLLSKPLQIGPLSVEFERTLFDWSSPTGRIYATPETLTSPSLSLGLGGSCHPQGAWGDLDVKTALRKFGPFSSREETEISYVAPVEFGSRLDAFHARIATYASNLNLGKFRLASTELIDRNHPDRYARACRSIAQSAAGIVLVVLPTARVSEAYYSSKRGLGAYQVRSQMIRWETALTIAGADTTSRGKNIEPIGLNLAAQLFDKTLRHGESIWHLASPAGSLSPDRTIYFMGFDVSRAPERRKEAAAYAAVCDSFGRTLHRRAIDTHKGEKIQPKVLSDWFFDVASNAFDETASKKQVDELILFKDGPIPPNQIVDYKRGTEDAKDRLVVEGIMNEAGNIRIVSAVKRGPQRIYGAQSSDYRIVNSALLMSPKEAVIVTSKAYHGTALPLKLRLEYQIRDDMQVSQVVKIFNDLRYLDYSSLFTQPKTILPLHIVQNLAKLSKEDVTVPYIPR